METSSSFTSYPVAHFRYEQVRDFPSVSRVPLFRFELERYFGNSVPLDQQHREVASVTQRIACTKVSLNEQRPLFKKLTVVLGLLMAFSIGGGAYLFATTGGAAALGGGIALEVLAGNMATILFYLALKGYQKGQKLAQLEHNLNELDRRMVHCTDVIEAIANRDFLEGEITYLQNFLTQISEEQFQYFASILVERNEVFIDQYIYSLTVDSPRFENLNTTYREHLLANMNVEFSQHLDQQGDR